MTFLNRLKLCAAAALAVSIAAPALSQGLAGSYLAARHASGFNDFRAAADYYTRAMVADPENPALMEAAARAHLSLGDLDRAVAIARRMDSIGAPTQIASIALLADRFQKGGFDGVLADLDAAPRIGPMVDSLLRAWAEIGAGRMSEALTAFDEVISTEGLEAFGLYHKALALALVGDLEGADDILSGRSQGTIALDRRGALAHVQILSQLDRNADAIAVIDDRFGPQPDSGLIALRDRLDAGAPEPFDTITSPTDGAAEVFYSVANALRNESNSAYTLVFSRTAEILSPGHIDAILLSAALLESMELYDLATEAYGAIPRDDPAFSAAEIGRAESLRRAGDTEEGIAALRALIADRPDIQAAHVALGDALRQEERYDEASRAYDAAVDLIETPSDRHWIIFFARGITHEREDRWDNAEADFRRALELRPNQPQVMNYLGYSFVEMGINLDEALDLIERAVAEDPGSGYIVDSLGWVLYRLGRFDEAVGHMERAAELLPVDPIVNDHLGDVYWAVGRRIEAEFQWRRALSFDPEEEDAARIRRKLEIGLDAVLIEEGEEPVSADLRDG
ncbi:MAG: tetratricopeptide repeat protein [Paracoccaceae bacterium]